MALLQQINSPQDLKSLNISQLGDYAEEVREFLIKSVSETGGHLASNLGIVELTVALHYVFNSPEDKFVWDVGHQSYVHKIITGRRDKFDTLRKFGGIAGFPKTSESEHDAFNTGHSSTSISAALGISRAKRLSGEKGETIAVIGDGALTGGMAYEALCDAGQDKNGRIIVIVNDNKMSIDPNEGGLATHLNNLRTAGKYYKFKRKVSDMLEVHPGMRKFVKKIKNSIKRTVIQGSIFEEVGFDYYGPYDGHNIPKLIKLFERIKNIPDNVVIHVITKKGKGYAPAEQNPGKYHGVGNFSIRDGKLEPASPDYSAIFGKKLTALAKQNPKIVAISASMPTSTGLGEFMTTFKDRFFDVGIAEQHAVTLAAGFATEGYVPVFAVYSSFLQRGFDQLLHDVALQNLHVVFCIDRAGLTCSDGETHHGLYDISYLKNIPNMTVLAPSAFSELEAMLEFAVNECEGPVAIRYPRGKQKMAIEHKTAVNSGAEVIRDGSDVTLFALGNMVSRALLCADILEKNGVSARVVDLRFAVPIDGACIKGNFGKLNAVLEDGIGAIYKDIADVLGERVLAFSYPNEPVTHGDEKSITEQYGLSAEQIAEKILKEVNYGKNQA